MDIYYTGPSKDHHFTPEQKSEYDALSARGRTHYDLMRWNLNSDHATAFRAAFNGFGPCNL